MLSTTTTTAAIVATEPIHRPGFGTAGTPSSVRVNHYEVTPLSWPTLHHYDVDIGPPRALWLKIWQAFCDQYPTVFAKTQSGAAAFDGRKNCFSPVALQLGETDRMGVEVTLPGERGTFRVRIQKVNLINTEEILSHVSGLCGETINVQTAWMALNVLLRYMPSIRHVTAGSGRSFYLQDGKQPLPGAAEMWPGFFQSMRPGVGKVFVNVDTSATAFYEPGMLHEQAAKFLGCRSVDELRRGLTEPQFKQLSKFVKRLRVEVVHRGEHNRKYTVQRLLPDTPAKFSFERDDGRSITVAQYFVEQYNIRLAYPTLPLVQVGGRNTYLPMEICRILPGQQLTRKLTAAQTTAMIRFTSQKPAARANKIQQGIKQLAYAHNPILQDAGIKISSEMAVVNARVLPPPKIESVGGRPFQPAGGAWPADKHKFAVTTKLTSWSIVNFAPQHIAKHEIIQRFMRLLIEVLIGAGLNVVQRTPPILTADPQGNVAKALGDSVRMARQHCQGDPQLMVCILPNFGPQLYPEIKRVTETEIGVVTQCLQSKHVLQPKKAYCSNVALKINAKLGGVNHRLSPGEAPFITDRPTIVFGADVSHPSPGDTERGSVAAVVASMDDKVANFAGEARVQSHRTEVIADMSSMVKQLLIRFHNTTKHKPQRILFYRDGVSEGQFQEVLRSEVQAVKHACASLHPDYKPKLTFVVVQKRHHTRLFPVGPQLADRSGNCMPGTVVDTGIVHPYEFDFFLQSHAGLLGTSRPAHYRVLYDENNFTADALQQLTYHQCYVYARCTRAVSIVPAAYYADLLATRAKMHHRELWSDSGLTSQSAGDEHQPPSAAGLKPAVSKVMYFV